MLIKGQVDKNWLLKIIIMTGKVMWHLLVKDQSLVHTSLLGLFWVSYDPRKPNSKITFQG